MPHGKITGARTPQEPCKPHSAYVSAELRRVRAGVHGPAPLHERSRESVLAEDRGDDYASGIIDASHEHRDAAEHRASSPPLSCPTTKATTTTAARTPAPTTTNRPEHRTGTPRTRHQHCALVVTGSCDRTALEPAACTPSTGPATGEGRAGGNHHQARLDRQPHRRRHRLGTKVGRDLTQRNEHALEFTGVRAPQGRRRVGIACPGDPKGGYPGAQARRLTRTKPTTPCFGPEPPCPAAGLRSEYPTTSPPPARPVGNSDQRRGGKTTPGKCQASSTPTSATSPDRASGPHRSMAVPAPRRAAPRTPRPSTGLSS